MLEKILTHVVGSILTFMDSFSQEQKNWKKLNKLWVDQGTVVSWGLRIVHDEDLFDTFYNGPYDKSLYHVKLVHNPDSDIWYCLSNHKRNTFDMEELSIFLADGVHKFILRLQDTYFSTNSHQFKADEMTVQIVDPLCFRRALTKRMYRNAEGIDDTVHQNWYKARIEYIRNTTNYQANLCPPAEE